MSARRNPTSPFLPITSLQAQQFHALTHSFPQQDSTIPSIFSSFRTLSIVTGVYPPGKWKLGGVAANIPRRGRRDDLPHAQSGRSQVHLASRPKQ
jgi:hypothetical protein